MSAIEDPAETFARFGLAFIGRHIINDWEDRIDVYRVIEGEWCHIATYQTIADALTRITKEETS